MVEWLLFTDGSVNTQTGDGYGAALWVTSESDTYVLNELKTRIQVQKFSGTSSTRLELQILLWALREIPKSCFPLTAYTDSQNILSLPGRRARLEAANFQSKNGQLLRNADLYRDFYTISDCKQVRLIKVKGHLPSPQKDRIDRLFNLVDKASRRACRKTG